jgi:hypothetical protein
MEARAELRQPRISKGLIAIVAVSVTLGLGVMAGTVAKNLNGSATTVQTHAIVMGKGGPAVQSVRHSGTQTGEQNPTVSATIAGDDRAAGRTLPGNAFVAPDAADHKSQAAPAPKAAGFSPALGYREGN